MSGHNHHIWRVTCCCPRRKQIILVQRHLPGADSVIGHCGQLVPPLRATQVLCPPPVPEPEVPPSCASPAMRFTAGLVRDAAAAGESRAWGAPALRRGLLTV